MFGRDPIALTVNNLSAKVSMEKLALRVENRLKTSGRMDTNGLAQQKLQDHK